MYEPQLQNIYNYPIYARFSKTFSDEGFIKIDNGSQDGTHWCCFIIKGFKSFYFNSFEGQPDKFLNQLPKPTLNHNYKLLDLSSALCGPYCLHFFYLIERMN